MKKVTFKKKQYVELTNKEVNAMTTKCDSLGMLFTNDKGEDSMALSICRWAIRGAQEYSNARISLKQYDAITKAIQNKETGNKQVQKELSGSIALIEGFNA